ncbi:MAG: Ig-like domain-containing protein, partial [Pirellulaceae bacterium]
SPQLTGVSIASDGKSLLYTPPADFNGEITFDYTVSDGVDDLSANVTVQIHPINDDPVAVDDTATIVAGTSNNFINVLANDTDIDGDQLRVQSVGQLSGNGTITVASSGSGLNYTPGQGFVGVDTVTYTITDNQGGTSQATLTLTVTGAGSDTFTVDEESVDNVFDVLQNDTGTGLTITAVGSTSNGGIVTIIEDGARLNYSRPADDDFFGTDTFTYTSTSESGQVSTGTVIVTVDNTNDPPTAVNDSFTVSEGSTGNTLNVLANDSNAPDPPGETLTIVSVDDTNTIGSVSIVNGSIRYNAPTTFPDSGLATGTDTFTYTIDDGSGLTAQATVSVDVVDFIPGSLSGFVYVDSNNDGVRDTGEEGFEGVTITLSGTNDFGNEVSLQTTTASDGAYTFDGLAPGDYTITQTQPTGERNGVPIVDGKDTIGSQGGTVSANDQFSITLAEGTEGGDNNFGELLGRTLAGSIVRSAGSELFGGLDLLLFASDGDMTIGNELASANSVGGTFQYSAIAPGSYRVVAETPPFLLSNESNVLEASVTADADSTNNTITIRGREAAYISLRDISTAAPTEYAHAAVG